MDAVIIALLILVAMLLTALVVIVCYLIHRLPKNEPILPVEFGEVWDESE